MKYNDINMLKDGLSYSDYFSDEISPEVRPIHNLTPMQEEENDYIGHSDIPTQSKDLFKGLWEDVLKNDNYWLDKIGKFYKAVTHKSFAEEILFKNNIPYDYYNPYSTDERNPGCYAKMYSLGFLRIKIDVGVLYAEYDKEFLESPTNQQTRALKTLAIESGLELSINNRLIELFESKYVNKDGRSLFIESMMPDNIDAFKTHMAQLFAHLQKELQLKTVPKVKLISDDKNADKVLGKTAYYNPDEKLIVLYITNRHQKDILRSFAHEVIHHWQHENEKLQIGEEKKGGTGDPQYAQNNPWLRQMEKQAYLLGNMLFRDWEDQKKAEDKKSGNDGKGGRVNKKVKETTYSLGNEYPPKTVDYRG